jgi:hypothetical protein
MERRGQIKAEELLRRMRSAFEKTMAEVAEAVNQAPDGQWIDASEERCRDVLGELRRMAYETAMQMRVEATETDPSFSPCQSGAARSRPANGTERLRMAAAASQSLREPQRRNGHAGG